MQLYSVKNEGNCYGMQAGGEKRLENVSYAKPLCTRTPDGDTVCIDSFQKRDKNDYANLEKEYSIYLNG